MEKRSLEAIDNSVSAEEPQVVVLDGDAVIVAVNEAWQRLASDGGLRWQGGGLGRSYLDVCDSVEGGLGSATERAEAAAAARGLRQVLSGKESYFRMEYCC
jgi:hypothetical protein